MKDTGRLPSMAIGQLLLNLVEGGTRVVRDVESVGDLRSAASSIHEIDAEAIRLVHAGRELCDDRLSLSAVGIQEMGNVFALMRLLGGGKKRKKKTYTKPKKIKHKHKKVKLAVLKYYKITGDGKVERLRRECPEDTCGAGVFMAAHADRMYCGKCSLTLVHEKDS